MKSIDPDNVTEDAYERIQKLLDSRLEQKPKVIVPEIERPERAELRKRMAEKLVDIGKIEEFHADLLSDRLLEMVEEEMDKAGKNTTKKIESGADGDEKFTGAFRRSED